MYVLYPVVSIVFSLHTSDNMFLLTTNPFFNFNSLAVKTIYSLPLDFSL